MKNCNVCSLDELRTQNLVPFDCCLPDSSVTSAECTLRVSMCLCVECFDVCNLVLVPLSAKLQEGWPETWHRKITTVMLCTGHQSARKVAPITLRAVLLSRRTISKGTNNNMIRKDESHRLGKCIRLPGKCHDTANVFTGGGGIDRLDFYGPM